MGDYRHLLAPGRIGGLELRNRIVMCPMGDLLATPDGEVSDRQTAYFEARSRGGAALLIVGSVAVSAPEATYHRQQLAASADHHRAGLTRLADRVHHHGAKIAAQLVHNGASSLRDYAEGRPVLVPSMPSMPRPDRLSGMTTRAEREAMMAPFTQPTSTYDHREADAGDLERVVAHFADAAALAIDCGFDGIEIHAGHGYLIDNFLSPASNHRNDQWGGTVEARARLLTDVLTAMRARVGSDIAVWCRLNAFEAHKEDGETFEDALVVADLAIAAGADALHLSAYGAQTVAVGITDAHTPHEPELLVPYAARLKERVAVPVITFGRIEPDAAERVLADGHADFIAMGRKLLADPDLPNKLAAGRSDDVRPCLYQYRCIGNVFLNESVACVANAATGHGDEAPGAFHTADPRHVLIAGGGPAGLETARLLSEHGHRVTLVDYAERLGGTLALAARTDDTLDRFLGWLLRGVEQQRIDVRLVTEVTPDLVAALDVDEVVVTTGGSWVRPDVPGGDLAHVRTVADLRPWLDDAATDAPGHTIVVLGGGKAALSIAALAADRGHAVTVLEPSKVFAPELGLPGRFRLVHDVEERGVRLVGRASLVAIDPDCVHAADADGASLTFAADTVITTVSTPTTALADLLRASDCTATLHEISSATHVPTGTAPPGGIEIAMAGAARVAAAIA